MYIYVSLMHTCLSKMFFVFLYSNNVRCIFNIEISCGRTIEILLLCVKYRLLINLNIKTKVNKNYYLKNCALNIYFLFSYNV